MLFYGREIGKDTSTIEILGQYKGFIGVIGFRNFLVRAASNELFYTLCLYMRLLLNVLDVQCKIQPEVFNTLEKVENECGNNYSF